MKNFHKIFTQKRENMTWVRPYKPTRNRTDLNKNLGWEMTLMFQQYKNLWDHKN